MDDSGLRGGWLKYERQRLRMTQRQIAAAVGTVTPTVLMVERYDRPVPIAWIAPLTARGFVATDGTPHVTGAWMRAERDRLGIAPFDLAAKLNTPSHRLIAGERFAHAIPAEWFPTLASLGFRFPALKTSAAPATQAEPIAIEIVESQPDPKPRDPAQPPSALPAAPSEPSRDAGQGDAAPPADTASAAPPALPNEAPPPAPTDQAAVLSPATLAIVQAQAELSRALKLSPLLAISRLAADLHAADPAMPAAVACQAIGVLCQTLQTRE